MRQTNVVFTGLPHFSSITASFLAARDRSSRFVSIDTSTRVGKARYLLELPRADAVFTMWGSLMPSRTVALALARGKRVFQFWMGSDVLAATAAVEAGLAETRLVTDCVHLCEAPWTRDELAAVGIEARLVRLPPFARPAPPATGLELPKQFSLCGYVGKGSERFYGLPELIRLAEDLPGVPIRISGTDSSGGAQLPPNVELLGWSDDLDDLFRDSVAFVRIPAHDGYSFSTREALAWSRYVISSYPYPHCLHAPDYDALRAHAKRLEARFDAGDLELNHEGRGFVLDEYEPSLVLHGLERALREVD